MKVNTKKIFWIVSIFGFLALSFVGFQNFTQLDVKTPSPINTEMEKDYEGTFDDLQEALQESDTDWAKAEGSVSETETESYNK